jgi:hypothetical protein
MRKPAPRENRRGGSSWWLYMAENNVVELLGFLAP